MRKCNYTFKIEFKKKGRAMEKKWLYFSLSENIPRVEL